jgi:hypothetical protein
VFADFEGELVLVWEIILDAIEGYIIMMIQKYLGLYNGQDVDCVALYSTDNSFGYIFVALINVSYFGFGVIRIISIYFQSLQI